MDSDSGDDKVAVQAVVKDVEYPAKARVIRAKVCKGEQQSSSKVITPTLQEDETIAPIETEIANSNDVNASTMDVSDIEKPITVQKASGESSVELLRKNIHNMELSSAVGLLKANDVIAFKVSLSDIKLFYDRANNGYIQLLRCTKWVRITCQSCPNS